MLLKYERLFHFSQHNTEMGSPVLSQPQQSLPVKHLGTDIAYLFLTGALLVHFTLESYSLLFLWIFILLDNKSRCFSGVFCTNTPCFTGQLWGREQ